MKGPVTTYEYTRRTLQIEKDIKNMTCIDLYRLAQTYTVFHKLSQTCMTLEKTCTVIFLVYEGLWYDLS